MDLSNKLVSRDLNLTFSQVQDTVNMKNMSDSKNMDSA
jgi:hypothetical protein